jgi:wyosine [tRNA(Phe)-imidazoG37] synthetase (radical SAM superfamily)
LNPAPALAGFSTLKVDADNLSQIQSNLAVVQDHARLFADFTFVYPVISRRSRGLSIGINLNPDKVCNFDCVYCEVDRRIPGKVESVDLNQMRDELTAMIRLVRNGGLAKAPKFNEVPWLTREIKDLAFSGDGEPTMIRNFADSAEVVASVKRAENLARTKMVLITDAAGLDKTDVRRGLEILDSNQGEIWGKLDAGSEAYFKVINRTHIRFERICQNLLETARVRPIVIQSLFVKLHGNAPPAEEIYAYCDRLNWLVQNGAQLREIHVYTAARPVPEPFVSKLDRSGLEALAEQVRERTGLQVSTFE